MLLIRLEEARNTLEVEVQKVRDLSPSLHEAIIEAGSVMEDALAVLVHFRQICNDFMAVERDAEIIFK